MKAIKRSKSDGIFDDKKIRKVVVSLSDHDFKLFDTYCEYMGATKSKVVRDLIKDAIKAIDIPRDTVGNSDEKKTKVTAAKLKDMRKKKK